MKAFRFSVALATLLATVACEDTINGPAEQAASVSVTPTVATMVVGQNRTLQAVVKSANGSVLHGRSVEWSTDDESVATVNAAGIVLAVSPGSAKITAKSDDRVGFAALTVQRPTVHSVVILHADPTVLDEGGSIALIAVARGADGSDLNGYPPSWTSSDPDVVWVSDTGGVVARNAGTAQVSATVEGKTATVTVRVRTIVRSVVVDPTVIDLAIGGFKGLEAAALNAAGAPLGRTFAWASQDPTIASVDEHGVVTAHRAGITEIFATVADVVGRATVRVGTVQRYLLESAEGRPIPAPLYTSEIVDDDGVPRTLRVVASAGSIRTLNHLYKQNLTLVTYVGDVVAWTMDFVDEGEFYYNLFTGDLMFFSDLYPGLEYTGRWVNENTGFAVTQQVDGDQPPFTFVFTNP